MKKIKPQYKIETPYNRPFYGCMGLTCSSGAAMKTNCICPVHTCGYSSRNYIVYSPHREHQINTVSSKTCPMHRQKLINVGFASPIPKKGSKERIQLIEKYKHQTV